MHDSNTRNLRAAQYVRMSTEHQQYSTENQSDKIRDYAASRNIEILRTYADEGKSGLNIGGRDGLQRLLADVVSGNTDFELILVYDVSRWGRFQDADESAHYEYLCKQAGIRVVYCAEQFQNDGSPVSTIVKGVKRAMAGEYSRELSAKVFAGQCRLIELGFRQGGIAGYGLRRVLIDQSGEFKAELNRGQQKSIHTDRVTLRPGPANEIATVYSIFRWFVESGWSEAKIAAELNLQGITTNLGRPWTRGVVHDILQNEKYIGNNIYNRRSFKLKLKRITNPPEAWVRKDGAFEPIVRPDIFFTAQGIIKQRSRRYSNEELLDRLGSLYRQKGFLSGLLIDESDNTPSSSAYRYRFGSLFRASKLVGFTPDRDCAYLEVNRRLRELYPEIVQRTEADIITLGGHVELDPATDMLQINGEFSASIVLSRCHQTSSGHRRWQIRLDGSLCPDITIAVRLDHQNQDPMDYYLLPAMDVRSHRFNLADTNGIMLDAYRFDDLQMLMSMAARVRIRRAA
jgi:DNA invertase Pin-like site-specific DNA recombinase